MSRDFKFEKRAILAGVALLLAADVALGVYSWHLSNSPVVTTQTTNVEAAKLKKLKAEIEDAEKNAANFPKTLVDCDKFESSLPPANVASSTIAAELGDLANKSGIQLTGIVFHDKEVGDRDITERSMEATISGGYDNVVKFLNNLQKSPNYYVVDSIDLATETTAPNLLHVGVHMRTFFRTVPA
ncbi:MAG TPA: hypothetical protein VKT53_01135 [Candidatus Acidoferrum sp.]|nr:hypothetical protein [Candidatus Acidoferrum sp.]